MVEALLTLREGDAAVGRDRIRLLEAVGREGSISSGARAVGLTYKAAWDGLDALARLFGRPVIETRVGGRAGGGARLTPAGLRLLAAFAHLEADLARAARRLDGAVAGTGEVEAGASTVLLTSARNAFAGTVEAIQPAALSARVSLLLPEGERIVARVTRDSVRALGLAEGGRAVALVKASFVDVARRGERQPSDDANVFEGVVERARIAGSDAEVVLAIGGGRTLTATPSAPHLRTLALAAGAPVTARFSAAQVILATIPSPELSE